MGGCRSYPCRLIGEKESGRQGLGKREAAGREPKRREVRLRAIAVRFSYRRRETHGHGVQSSWAEGRRDGAVWVCAVCCVLCAVYDELCVVASGEGKRGGWGTWKSTMHDWPAMLASGVGVGFVLVGQEGTKARTSQEGKRGLGQRAQGASSRRHDSWED